MIYDYLDKLKEIIKKLTFEASICKRTDPKKKKESCMDAILLAVIKTRLSIEKLLEIYNIIEKGIALNLDFFFNNYSIISLWNFIHPKVLDFAKNLFSQTPKGLGTPNAASGEGELMFILLHPNIKKPTRGDLSITSNGEEHIFELKGALPRVTTAVRGFTFCSRSLEIAAKYGINPNTPNTPNASAAIENENRAQNEIYVKQLNDLPLNQRKAFIWEWLEATGGVFPTERRDKILTNVLPNGNFDQKGLQKEIVKGFFAYMCNSNNFHSMILLGDGNKVKIVPRNPNIFNSMVDKGLIKIKSDYFRIAQPNTLGWYIE
ncbi:MAG: hypothetical protein ACFFD2_19530 [Promethearchaeota archaeon]